MIYSENQVIFSGSGSESDIEYFKNEALDFIKRKNLTSEDCKMVKRDNSILVILKREREI